MKLIILEPGESHDERIEQLRRIPLNPRGESDKLVVDITGPDGCQRTYVDFRLSYDAHGYHFNGTDGVMELSADPVEGMRGYKIIIYVE